MTTEIESGAPAPATSGAVPFVSSTEGMSQSQAAAMKFVDSRRAEIATGNASFALTRQNREALDHCLRGGPVPSFLQSQEQESTATTQSHVPVPEGYEPMTAEEKESLHFRATITGIPPESAKELQTFAEAAALPKAQADILARRVAHHISTSGNGNLAPLSQAEHQELAHEAARAFGTTEKFAEISNHARAFLNSVGLLKYVDEHLANTSLVYDPQILIALSGMATARGVKA